MEVGVEINEPKVEDWDQVKHEDWGEVVKWEWIKAGDHGGVKFRGKG